MTTYTPTVWQDDDAITAEKLNKIEDRIEEIQNSQKIIIATSNTIQTTYNEVKALLDTKIFPCIKYTNRYGTYFDYIYDYYIYDNHYYCSSIAGNTFMASTPNEYFATGMV